MLFGMLRFKDILYVICMMLWVLLAWFSFKNAAFVAMKLYFPALLGWMKRVK